MEKVAMLKEASPYTGFKEVSKNITPAVGLKKAPSGLFDGGVKKRSEEAERGVRKAFGNLADAKYFNKYQNYDNVVKNAQKARANINAAYHSDPVRTRKMLGKRPDQYLKGIDDVIMQSAYKTLLN